MKAEGSNLVHMALKAACPRVMNTQGAALLIAVMIIASVLAAGCNKKPEYVPGSSVQGFRASISKILFSPIAFDGATVAVEGIVNKVVIENAGPEEAEMNFILTDLNGNYVNVLMIGEWDIADNDYMVVGGIYRKNGNVIEAEQFEKIVLEQKDKDKEIKERDNW